MNSQLPHQVRRDEHTHERIGQRRLQPHHLHWPGFATMCQHALQPGKGHHSADIRLLHKGIAQFVALLNSAFVKQSYMRHCCEDTGFHFPIESIHH